MAINWIDINERKPEDGKTCITKMKHGIISGDWDEKQDMFRGYYWHDLTWYGTHWAPIEETE